MNRLSLEMNGTWFELHVANELSRLFPESVVLHDLPLYSYYLSNWYERPITTQIDLVFITPYRIYVIEAKKWGDEICGNREDYKWTGKPNAKNFVKNMNPVSQNLVHLRELKNLLRRNNYDVPDFESCICVPDGTKIITDCKEVLEMSQMIYKLQCDFLDFRSGRLKSSSVIDVYFWDNAISEAIRKEKRKH